MNEPGITCGNTFNQQKRKLYPLTLLKQENYLFKSFEIRLDAKEIKSSNTISAISSGDEK